MVHGCSWCALMKEPLQRHRCDASVFCRCNVQRIALLCSAAISQPESTRKQRREAAFAA